MDRHQYYCGTISSLTLIDQGNLLEGYSSILEEAPQAVSDLDYD